MPYRARLDLHGIAGRRALNGPAPPKVRERRPERDQGFRSPLSYVAASQLCTGSAFWALLIAAYGYAIYHLHATPGQAGLLSLAWGAPPVLLGWPVGRLVDLRGPKSVAIYSGTVNIAVSLALAAMPSWRLLLGLMLCAGVARAVNQPALDAMPSWLVRAVDHRVSSAWLGLAMHLPLLAGPLLAAGLISLAGYACVYLVNAGLHVAALLAIAPVRTRNCADDTGEQAPRDRYLLRRTAARPILALSFVVAISYSFYDLLEMFYVRDTLHSGFRMYTALLVLYGLGLLITAAFLMRHPRFLPLPRALGPIVVFLGLSEIAYVLTARLWVCSAAAVLLGVASALFAPTCRTGLLAAAPVDRHGAVMAAWRSTQSAGSVIPPLALGTISQAAGARPTMITTAALVVVAGLAGWPIRGRRRTTG